MVFDFLIFILRFITEVIFLELIAFVGRVVVRVAGLVVCIASFGSVRVAPSGVADHEFNWFGCRRGGDGLVEVEPFVAGWIGLLIFFIGLAVFLHFFDANAAQLSK